jgi:hypothetical protein
MTAEEYNKLRFDYTEIMGMNPKDKIGREKIQYHLLPTHVLQTVAEVMRGGAKKYGEYNWRGAKVSATVYTDAAQRHLNAYLQGEEYDPESKLPHLAHLIANALILLDAGKCDTLIDDRPIIKTNPAQK